MLKMFTLCVTQKFRVPPWSNWLDFRLLPSEFKSRCWAYLKGVSSFTLLHYLCRLLSPFSLSCVQMWPQNITQKFRYWTEIQCHIRHLWEHSVLLISIQQLLHDGVVYICHQHMFWYSFAWLCMWRHHSMHANTEHVYIVLCIINYLQGG